MLTKAQETKLWDIKLTAYDFYGMRFDKESLELAESIQKAVDSILLKHGHDPVVLVNAER